MATEVADVTVANGHVAQDQIPVENPATGQVIAHVPDLSPEDLVPLVERGRAAQPAWEALGFDGRGRVLRRMARWLLEHQDEVIDVIRSETGKTYEDAQLAEISYGAAAFNFWAQNAEGYLADEKVKSANVLVKGKKLVTRYRPLGLVGVIGPWNYPLTNSFGDCIPALAAGNSVILKPSEVTPLTSLKLEEGLKECGIPEGVFQIATGRGATGAALIDHVDMIMFTGSTATGKKVMAKAAETLTPVSLELGGKDPMIVLSDADVERAANSAVYWGMFNAGQTCISLERLYVEEPIYDEFVSKVVEKARALRQGFGESGSADVGSMTFPPQVDIVERHVEDAKAKGAKVLVGGERGKGQGYWFEPTVLVDVDHSMECMTEETFGPTLPIMKVRDEEEAIRLANDSPYGLGASVFSKDVTRGERVARRIEAGAVCVNDALVNYTALELPMGGAKTSGLGTRHGAGGIRKYCQQQSLLVTRFAMKKELYMYPYNTRATKLLGKALRFLYGRGKA
ncbi:aldehyde dehydrogenase family protein [Conexibacter sp. SYSU D00693]|uniref:aldehyde dehydrogenase family protein n=1 Tax=Conexibacter sp. SYSU D00693 TaxID=2812560 RepID=UPI00196B2DFD|nr:aldehyde dehydrogenase family protein [Conexibacter sp. SYSU D00693]